MDSNEKAFLGRGWGFPIAVETDRGLIKTVEYEKDIKESIVIILSTSKGERVMRPDFGCGIHDLLFGAISMSLITQIKEMVSDALRKYEARIELLLIDVDVSDSLNGFLNIRLDYSIRATNQKDNFVYPFYFKEAF